MSDKVVDTLITIGAFLLLALICGMIYVVIHFIIKLW